MGYLRRVTLRCLCEDLASDWRDVAQQRAFVTLRTVAASDQKDSDVVRALDEVPTTALAAHPLVDSFRSAFESNEPSVLRESISGLTNPHWWKQKTSRWRGAATDAAMIGVDEAWPCAGGLRAGKEARDFYVSFTTSIKQHGPDKYLPADEDRRVQAVEEKLARREAWMTQMRLATLICLAEADTSGERRSLHVPLPGPASVDKALIHVRFELERIRDDDEELVELFVTVEVEDHTVPNLVQSAIHAVRSVVEPVEDAWRVLPGPGTSEIWAALVAPETLTAAHGAVDTGELPEELAESALLLGIHAHYAPKGHIVDATVEGDPVRGLCGQWFVPTTNPDTLPLCPTCKEKHAALAD